MKLSFFGAAKEVTGSCHCLEVDGIKILVDCGLQQGQDEKDDQRLPFNASEIDAVIVTHAHIDHSGRLPLMVKEGFGGKIYATGATCELLSIMLADSAYIQEMEAHWKSRKSIRAGKGEVEPLYTVEDAQRVKQHFVECSYNEKIDIADGVRIRFTDAGHLLGSSSVEIWAKENGVSRKIVFSGDIGNLNQPIVRDPQYIEEADYVIMESTYGNRRHVRCDDYTAELAKVIDETLKKGGNVVIPSFAVGRTQELLYFIREMKERNLVPSCPGFPVYVDSPLATEATKIFAGNLAGYVDEETLAVLNSGRRPIRFSDLILTESAEESKMINELTAPKAIISSSGMCEGGRIRHHLKHNLWRPECAVVFVGYQAAGTLGRILIDGAKKVKLFGEEIEVNCSIHNFRGLSAHADRDGLLRWIGSFTKKPKRVFVVHGEAYVCESFAYDLSQLGFTAAAPKYTAVFDIIKDSFLYEGVEYERLTAKERLECSPVYEKLVAAGTLLLDVIRRNKGGTNKDLSRFAEQIEELALKWDR